MLVALVAFLINCFIVHGLLKRALSKYRLDQCFPTWEVGNVIGGNYRNWKHSLIFRALETEKGSKCLHTSKGCKESNVRPQMLSILFKSLCISQLLNKPLLVKSEIDVSKKQVAFTFFAIFNKILQRDMWKNACFKAIPFPRNVDIYWDMYKQCWFESDLKKLGFFLKY